jgi:lipoprotein signal peptidase
VATLKQRIRRIKERINVADIAVSIGAVLLLLSFYMEEKRNDGGERASA